MNYRSLIQTLQDITTELHQNKWKEIQKLAITEKAYTPYVIDLRKEEANKLKQLKEGLTLVESTGFLRMEAYLSLDKKLRHLTLADPSLKGHIITLGPDQPELKPFFSRVTYNIPITFYKP